MEIYENYLGSSKEGGIMKRRNRVGPDRQLLTAKIIRLANLSGGKKTSGYLTKKQMAELVVFLAVIREGEANVRRS